MGTAQENFCLRWNDFESNLATAFSDLRNDEELCDVSLATDDEAVVAAHKVVLSACSPHLKEVIRKHIRSGRGLGQSSNMLIYLRGVRHADLMSILEFMYRGSVNVAQEDLNSFLAVAEDLKVRGLTQNTNKDGTVSSKNGTGVGKRSKPSSATPLPAKKFRPSSQSSTPVAAAGSGPSSSTQHASSASSSGGAAPGSSHSEIQLKTEHHKDGDHDEDDDGGGGGGGGAGADDFDDTGDDWGGEAGTGGDSLGFEAGGGDDSGAGPSDLGKVEVNDPAAGVLDRQQLSSKAELKNFVQESTTHVGAGILCNICGKVIRHITNVNRHFLDMHAVITSAMGYNCPACKRIYKSKNAILGHIYSAHRDWGGKINVEQFAVQGVPYIE